MNRINYRPIGLKTVESQIALLDSCNLHNSSLFIHCVRHVHDDYKRLHLIVSLISSTTVTFNALMQAGGGH